MKKKFKCRSSDIASINNSFHKNNINVSFEKADNYYNCLNEISYITYKAYIKYINGNIWSKQVKQFNLTTQRIENIGKFFFYHSSLLQDDTKIHLHMTDIRDLFRFEYGQSSVYDLDQEFGIIYDDSLKVKKKYVYNLSSFCLNDFKKDSLLSFLRDFRVPDYLHDNLLESFFRKGLFFDDLHFNFLNKLINVGFVIEKNCDLRNIFVNSCQKYEKIDDVFNFLYDSCDSTSIKIEFSPQREKNIFSSVEVKIDHLKIKSYIKYLADANLLCNNTYFNDIFDDMKYDSLYFKFLWNKNGKLNIILSSCLSNSDIFLLNNVGIID